MDGFGARLNDSGKRGADFRVDQHALGDQGSGIESSHLLETKEAFVVDVPNEESDLVHVGRYGDGGTTRPVTRPYQVSQPIDRNVIHQRREFLSYELAHQIFSRRNTG